MCVKVSPGKAYVRGHDVEKPNTTIIDVDKPRDKEEFNTAKVNFKLGTLLKLNNVHGTPVIGLNNTIANSTVSLRSQRKPTGNNPTHNGAEIGRARIYAFENTDAEYKDATTQFDLYVFDIQTYTQIVLNTSISSTQLPNGSFVEGLSSGASGFAVSAGSGTSFNLEQVSGTFIRGEQLRINGSSVEEGGSFRSIKSVTRFGLEDVKAVSQLNTFVNNVNFSGDLVLQPKLIKELGLGDEVNISAASGGVSSLSCAGKTFGSLKVDDIIIINLTTDNAPRFNRVSAISTDLKTVSLEASTTVTGVSVGTLMASLSPTGIHVARPQIFLNDSGLFAELQKKNVSDVSTAQSKLFIKKQVEKTTSGTGTLAISLSDAGVSDATFAPYDGDRYSVSLKSTSDTRHQALTESQVQLVANNQQVNIKNLAGNANVVINVTLEKDLINNKTKNVSRSNSIVINKTSRVGVATDGLTSSAIYGRRVDDKEVSLNTPDVYNVVGVFESVNLADPVLDKLVFVSGLALDSNTILGEKIKGAQSGAIAVLAGKTNATTVEVVNLTQNKFIIGESITFEESNITTNLQGIVAGLFKDVSSNFILDDGQRDEFADYSRIVRKDGATIPSRRIRVIFDKFTVPSNDTGDLFTVDSYPANNFKDVPLLKGGTLRASDTLDFRPRVDDYPNSGNISPFSFSSRVYSESGTNPTLVPAPNEASTVDFKFYLPRIDKLVLDPADATDKAYTSGYFQVIKGVSSQNPIIPADIETAMTIATIEVPAYLYDTKDAVITVVDNRRYTMRDIGNLEDRIENLEELTSLSLLELDTKALQIQDADGLSRFKTGFFVDDFKNTNLLDRGNPDCKCDVIASLQHLVTPTDFYSVKPELAISNSLNPSTADFSSDLELLDSGVRKTGDLITLDYDEVVLLDQPLASRIENVNPFMDKKRHY